MKKEEIKNQIQVGDRVTYKYKEESNIFTRIIVINSDIEITLEDNKQILKIERIGSSGWYTVYEKQEKKELLTEDEREFLKLYLNLLKSVVHIIQLEKSNYETVRLWSSNENDETEYIYSFDISSDMFKKLNENKRYTLSELELEE